MNVKENMTQNMKKDLSVILAIRNEAEHIQRCLDSLIHQNFSHERYEIIVIDGMSNDKTRNILNEYKAKFPNLITLLDNHQKFQGIGRNIGIKQAKGKTVLIFSGHAYVEVDYLNKVFAKLDESPSDVAGVGGVHFAPDDDTYFNKIMADVQNTIIGGGGTSYRQSTKDAYVDTIAFVAYKKNIVENVGLYDERFDVGEDLELNLRLRKAGFKLMIIPDAKSYYYRKHNSLKLLLVRMYKYGFWRSLVNKIHPDSFKIPFLIPIILSLSLTSLPAFMFLYAPLAVSIILGLGIYFMAIFVSSLQLTIKHKDGRYMISIPIYLIEHFSFGIGFIIGLFYKVPKIEKHFDNNAKLGVQIK